MFNEGDVVLYGSNGVCRVRGTTTKKFAGESAEYYVLVPVYSESSTLFVPTGNEELVGKMRYILSSDEITSVIRDSDGEPQWIDNKNDRFEACKEVISNGDFKKLVLLVRLLRKHERQQAAKGKHLHIADERFLKEAEKMVSEEISVALKVERSEAIPMLFE